MSRDRLNNLTGDITYNIRSFGLLKKASPSFEKCLFFLDEKYTFSDINGIFSQKCQND